MTVNIPLNIIHQDNHILVVQTLTDNIKNPYGTFNLGLHVGDNSTQVLANRAKLLAELKQLTNHSIQNIHWLNQVHGDSLLDIDNLADNQQYSLSDYDSGLRADYAPLSRYRADYRYSCRLARLGKWDC